jgi:hypothetical protein
VEPRRQPWNDRVAARRGVGTAPIQAGGGDVRCIEARRPRRDIRLNERFKLAPARLLAITITLLAWHAAAASAAREAPVALAHAETQYADWLDATSAVASIDSGLMTRLAGRDRRQWELRRVKLTALLESELSRIDESALDALDARALRAMRKGLISNALDPGEANPGHCAARNQSSRSIESAAPGDPLPLQLALYDCFEEIGDRMSFEGKALVRTTALQWLQEFDDAERRRRLFLLFTPLWTAVNAANEADSPYRRMIGLAAAQAHGSGSSPIDDAATTLGITPVQMQEWLRDILTHWRTHLKGPPVQPWDYWYAAAGAGRDLSHAIPRDAILPLSERFYRDLGADLVKLGVRHDLEVRPGKAPLAYTDYVRIGRRIGERWRAAIPRVSANYEQGGLFVLNELVHEDGHAVHEAALRTRPAFYSLGDDLFVEAFADVTAWSTLEPAWQRKYLGSGTTTAASLRQLFSDVMLDVAWGLFELTMLQDPSADPNFVWTEITSRYLNVVAHPELSWWALRVQLVRWPGYMINYALGAVLTADIRERIAEAVGPFDTGNARWYEWTSLHLLRFGTSLDTATLLRQFLGRPVSTASLLSQLQRLDDPPGAGPPAPP